MRTADHRSMTIARQVHRNLRFPAAGTAKRRKAWADGRAGQGGGTAQAPARSASSGGGGQSLSEQLGRPPRDSAEAFRRSRNRGDTVHRFHERGDAGEDPGTATGHDIVFPSVHMKDILPKPGLRGRRCGPVTASGTPSARRNDAKGGPHLHGIHWAARAGGRAWRLNDLHAAEDKKQPRCRVRRRGNQVVAGTLPLDRLGMPSS